MIQVTLNSRYQLIKELGYGGFGTTYLAKDIRAESEHLLCAVKKLNSEVADLDTARQLFKREADTLLRLQEIHQVPKFIDYFEEDNCNYIVEEYIEGDSLENLLDRQWNIENVMIFLWEILSILQLLHSKNIVHRDLKPSNLIQRRKDNKFTIIDFGAVKEIEPHEPQKIGTRIYHQGYAPAEQMQGMPRLNSDIYALGMTAIQLLTKEPPREIIRDASDRAIAAESKLAPSWLIDILNKMVRSDFKRRYQSVEEVLKDLGQRNRLKPAENLAANNLNLAETHLIHQENENLPQRRYDKKLWYILLIVLPLSIAAIEAIHPWLRTRYYLRQGNSLLDDRQAQASLSKFQQVIALQRDSAAAWKGRGDALFILGRYSGALGAYNKAIAIEPENQKTLNNKGRVLYQQGQLQQAIDTYERAIEADPENAEAWSGKGLAYMSLQQPELALESFNRAQSIKPEEPNFWLQKGIVLRALKRPAEADKFYQEAIAVYNEIIAEEKSNPLFWADRGFVLLQLNRPKDAFASYDRALALDRNFYEALLGKANVYSSVKDYERSLKLLDRAKEIRPQDERVWYNRGNLLLQAFNNPEQALTSFERATKLNPNFYPAWLGQGLALNSLQKYADALSIFDTAEKLNPQDPFLWMNRGIALEALGEINAAIESYRTAAIKLKFPPAKEPLERLQNRSSLS